MTSTTTASTRRRRHGGIVHDLDLLTALDAKETPLLAYFFKPLLHCFSTLMVGATALLPSARTEAMPNAAVTAAVAATIVSVLQTSSVHAESPRQDGGGYWKGEASAAKQEDKERGVHGYYHSNLIGTEAPAMQVQPRSETCNVKLCVARRSIQSAKGKKSRGEAMRAPPHPAPPDVSTVAKSLSGGNTAPPNAKLRSSVVDA